MKASRHTVIHASVWVAILVIFAPALTAARQDTAVKTDALTANHPWIGEPAPDFNLVSTTGDSVALSGYKGQKFLVVHFAASW